MLLNGSPYAEAAETRLRTRYAVLSALGRAQYLPTESDRLKFVRIEMDDCVETTVCYQQFDVRYNLSDGVTMPGNENDWHAPQDQASLQLRIPEAYDSVLVLWLDETNLRKLRPDKGSPAASLPTRLDRLVRALVGRPQEDGPVRWDLAFIGPNNSDQLSRLTEPDKSFSTAYRARFLSPRATAPDAILKMSSTHSAKIDTHLTGFVRSAQETYWPIERTIATDDQLVTALLKELELRQAAPGDRRYMVLVGEWDTLYSRGLGRTLAAQLNARDQTARLAPGDRAARVGELLGRRETWNNNPAYLREFSYLRGLDGQTPKSTVEEPAGGGSSSGRDQPDKRNGQPRLEVAPRDPDHAEGASQYDYLRRLERQLLALQAELGARPGLPRAEIASIGVVGSDTYDKLLVMRALRRSFPHAVFFTTDLDSAYLENDERDHTRNLVIAAPHGLGAPGELQGRIPPFRDSYQTALFLTVLHALKVQTRATPADDWAPLALGPQHAKPQIFELGHRGFVPLSEPPADARPAGLWARWQTPLGAGIAFGLGLILLAGALLWLWMTCGELRDRRAGLAPTPLHTLTQLTIGCSLLSALVLDFACLCGPDRAGYSWWQTGLLLAGPFLVVGIYSWLSTRYERPADPAASPRALVQALMSLVLFLVILGFGTRLIEAKIASQADEEPFAWFAGHSIWPTEIVRLLAMFLSLAFALGSQRRLLELKLRLAAQYRLPRPDEAACQLPQLDTLPGTWARFVYRLWPLSRPAGAGAVPDETGLWAAYCSATLARSRGWRVLCWLTLYLVFFCGLMAVTGFPAVPARGPWSFALDKGVLCASVLAYCYLLFYVLDALVLCAVFVHRLEDFIGRQSQLSEGATIHLINDLTEEVIRLVYLPFTVLFMLVAARNSLFDNWDWPAGLLAVFSTGLFFIILAAALLQHRAQAARNAALVDTANKLLAHRQSLVAGAENPPGRPAPAGTKEQIDWLKEQRDQIQSFDGLIFQKWYNNPLYRAMLIPLGGLGSIQALEHLSAFF